MIRIETTCHLCGAASQQPLLAGLRFADDAALDGSDRGQTRRGMMLCHGCSLCAPDLARPVPGLSRRAIRAGIASPTYRAALGETDAARPEARRWFAYAITFARHLAPAAAGRAWAAAAAELEAAHAAGLPWTRPVSPPDLIETARREAVRALRKVVRADFPASGAAALRPVRRRWLGETAFGSLRLHRDEAGTLSWRRDLDRIETACLLAEMHRRLGEFGAVQAVADRVLRASVPAQHAEVLQRQVALALERDAASRTLRPTVAAASAPVAATTAPEPVMAARPVSDLIAA